MAKRITRCPKCKTAFRVTEAHLNTPKGAVRCGSCLNIFVARNYLVTPGDSSALGDLNTRPHTKTKPQAKTVNSKSKSSTRGDSKKTALENIEKRKPKKPGQNVSKRQPDPQETLISDDMHETKSLDELDANIIMSGPTTVEDNLFEVSRKSDDKDENFTGDTDESWALDLLNDSGDSSSKLFKSTRDTRHNKAEKERDEKTNNHKVEKESLSPEFTSITDDTDDDFDHSDEESFNSEHHEEEFTNTEKFSTFEIIGSEDDIDEEINDDQYRHTGTQSVYVDAIEPEAVEFSWKNRGSNIWHSNRLWTALSLIAATFAFVQLAYFKFDDLNRIKPYRDYYQIACNYLDCKLPALVDLSQIKAANLVVRSHPELQGMLLVDAILQNKAGYEQAFPALDLVFTDISNKPVTAKRFLPSEYLAGELAGRTVMPSNQPIHIALQIEDPGEVAVSYQMSISQAEN